jgi:hypothetical protein
MTTAEALALLDRATAQLRCTRSEHERLIEALNTLATATNQPTHDDAPANSPVLR